MPIISSIINAVANSAMAKKQFEYDKELAEQQNKFNMDMWKMQQDYNTPQNQMNRLVSAGLSPNLAYSQVSTGNATSAPEQVAAGRKAPNLGVFNINMLQGVGAMLGMLSTVQNLKGQLLENLVKANDLGGQKLLGINKNPDYATMAKVWSEKEMPFMERLRRWFLPTPEPNMAYANYLQKDLALRLGEARTDIMGEQKSLVNGKAFYQSLVNDWFKADRIFNYVNNGLRTVGGFMPKLKVERSPFRGRY